MPKQPNTFIFAGANASGKSTYITHLLNNKIDEVGAERFVGKGDSFVKVGPDMIRKRVHSVFLKSEQIKDLIN